MHLQDLSHGDHRPDHRVGIADKSDQLAWAEIDEMSEQDKGIADGTAVDEIGTGSHNQRDRRTDDDFDIDINNQTIAPPAASRIHENCAETLRWTAVLSDKLRCGISAAQGVESSDDVVKLLLAGAQTVQVYSCLQQHGIEYIRQLNEGLRIWMEAHGYEKIDQFRGKLAFKGNDVAQMAFRIRRMMDNGV